MSENKMFGSWIKTLDEIPKDIKGNIHTFDCLKICYIRGYMHASERMADAILRGGTMKELIEIASDVTKMTEGLNAR